MPGMMLTESQMSDLPMLEPALEALLRSADLDENLISLFRFQKILDRQLFVALDADEAAIMKTLAKAFQLDSEEFEDKLELAKISKAWSTAKVQSDTKRKVDAVQKARGEPVQLLSEDWASLMRQFKKKYGKQHPSKLPGQSYFEAFGEKLASGELKAETLAQVISETEEEEQRKLKPEASRHLGINLDASLMIQTRRRYLSAMPQNTEQLRIKYRIMSNMWLLAKMRQPGRRLYEEFNDRTWSDLLDELLSEDMFQLEQEVVGEKMITPRWEHCLEYEYQLRKEAIKRATEDNLPLFQCLWAVYEDQAHKMKHWISLLTIANASLGDNSLKELRRENTELKKALSNTRSRSPRGKARGKNRQALPAPPQQLALAATAHTEQSRNKGGKNAGGKHSGGKGNKGGKGKKGKGAARDPAVPANPSGFRSFDTIMTKNENRQHFFKTRGQMICYDFQSGRCANTPCNKVHACIGCGIYGKAYNSCGCLESKAI